MSAETTAATNAIRHYYMRIKENPYKEGTIEHRSYEAMYAQKESEHVVVESQINKL